MSQEPWNEEIYEVEDNSRKSRTKKGKANTLVFSILVGLFVIIVAAITVLAIYLANGGSNTDSTQEFYNANTTTQAKSGGEANDGQDKPAATTSEQGTTVTTTTSNTTTTSSSAPAVNADGTLTVQAGEGQASIAERAGISIAELERLNPDKMATGSWLAHPGDTVRVK